MSKPTQALPVKLVFSIFAPAAGILNGAINRLSALYGQPDFISGQMPFDYTDYYHPEMGERLVRRFISMEELIRPEALPDVKLVTNEIEKESSVDAHRQVNIDPGYLSQSHLILATGKGYSHRPYLRDGIYADLTLIYQGKKFCALPWTYPDYADEQQLAMLSAIRSRYLLQLKTARVDIEPN
ncbi:MAG: DUF4416 family protein [Deltaproteobacteria bacterium]